MKDTFDSYHPIINFAYFCAVIVLGMFLLHPILLAIAVTAAAVYAVKLGGKNTLKFILCFIIPMIVVISVLNPLINHRGVTTLTYLGSIPITLEAVSYGIASGFMFAAILLWFSCYNAIMTSDKITYLFGRIIPSMSLIFSMVMRFVPHFKAQIKVVSQAQKCVGRDISNGSFIEKAKHGLKILSIMVTWVLENAIDTADSMRSRGYGLKDRSSFSIYRFDARDCIVAVILVVMTGIVLAGALCGICKAEYYPAIKLAGLTPATIIVYAAYLILCFLPILLDVKEELQWRHSQSKI